MSDEAYLKTALSYQTFSKDDPELKALRDKRDEVENVLKLAFPNCKPTIKYGGSYAKHTMIKKSYDLDIVCFFGQEETDAGNTLSEIYESVQKALESNYYVSPKTSALRIEENHGKQHTYTHIDVVPGRFVDDTRTDVFMYQNGGEKSRLKTNTKTHVLHIRDSGFTPAIRLLKLWREEFGNFKFKTFVLELLAVDLLTGYKESTLDEQIIAFWQQVKDKVDTLTVKDPANPSGNDLSDYLDTQKNTLSLASDIALRTLENSGWETIFPNIESVEKAALIDRLPYIKPQGTMPWGIREG